jgi:3-phosphoshikimate 1-carboxyvinyltransferase
MGKWLEFFNNKDNISIDCGIQAHFLDLYYQFYLPIPKKLKCTGDRSLNKRPMDRIMNPLEKLGAFFQTKKKVKRTLPCYITGSEMPIKIDHEEKIGSGQIKGGLILASLGCPGISTIKEFKNKQSRKSYRKNAKVCRTWNY